MASVNLAFILSVTSLLLLLLLSDASSLPSTADDSTAAAFALEAPGDANPTEVLDPRLESNTVTSTEANLPVVVDGFDHVGLSLRRPFHRRSSHCHHGHRLRGRKVVVPYGEHGEWSSASTSSTAAEDEKDGRWHIMNNKEHNKKKKRDSDDEGMDFGKKELRKKNKKKEKGGWMKWFWALWD